LKFWKQWLDRRAIQLAARMVAKPTGVAIDHAEVDRALRDPGFLRPPESEVQIECDARGGFSFPSLAPVRFERSNTVHGRFFPAEHWRKRPLVVLVHGWNAELHYLHGCPVLARSLNRRGVNAICLELPFHLQRRPRGEDEMRDFISDDLAGMLGAARQALADFEALLRWARREGCPKTALMGFSLGAWLAGLHATVTATADALAMVTPVSDLELAVATLLFCHPIRAGLERAPVSLAPLNLDQRKPLIDAANILLVESRYDLFVPQASCDALAKSWELKHRMRVNEGHLSVLASRKPMQAALDWLAHELSA
jgi:dienelactone hydrolase